MQALFFASGYMNQSYDEIDAILGGRQAPDEIDVILGADAQPQAVLAPLPAAELQGIGKALPQERSLLGEMSDLGVSISRGMVAVPSAVAGLADMALGGRVGRWLNQRGIDFSEIDRKLQQDYSPSQ